MHATLTLILHNKTKLYPSEQSLVCKEENQTRMFHIKGQENNPHKYEQILAVIPN